MLAGDPAPDGSGPLELARGVEMGHIFQLGRKYAEALDLKVLDENGKLVTVTMGSYGVGVSRAVAAIAESTHDELGPGLAARGRARPTCTSSPPARTPPSSRPPRRWPASWSPPGSPCSTTTGRRCRPGVKFKDAELLGMPTIVTVGRGLAEGTIEVRDRATGEREEVPGRRGRGPRARRRPGLSSRSSCGCRRRLELEPRARGARRRAPSTMRVAEPSAAAGSGARPQPATGSTGSYRRLAHRLAGVQRA